MLGWVDDNSPSNTLSYQYVHVQCPSWQLLKCQKVNMLLALALWRHLHGYIFYRALSLSLTLFHWSFWTSFMKTSFSISFWVIHSILEQNWIEISFIFRHSWKFRYSSIKVTDGFIYSFIHPDRHNFAVLKVRLNHVRQHSIFCHTWDNF